MSRCDTINGNTRIEFYSSPNFVAGHVLQLPSLGEQLAEADHQNELQKVAYKEGVKRIAAIAKALFACHPNEVVRQVFVQDRDSEMSDKLGSEEE